MDRSNDPQLPIVSRSLTGLMARFTALLIRPSTCTAASPGAFGAYVDQSLRGNRTGPILTGTVQPPRNLEPSEPPRGAIFCATPPFVRARCPCRTVAAVC